jgi:hypothetical protein
MAGERLISIMADRSRIFYLLAYHGRVLRFVSYTLLSTKEWIHHILSSITAHSQRRSIEMVTE